MHAHVQPAGFHPHPGPFHPPGGGPSPHVELGPAENAIIAKTASRAHTWGIVAMVVGALATFALVSAFVAMELLIAATPSAVSANVPRLVLGALIPAALVHLAVGVVYMRAGGALQDVVDTQGDDVRHLMTALGRLRLAFQIEVGVTVVSMILGLVVGIASSTTTSLEVR